MKQLNTETMVWSRCRGNVGCTFRVRLARVTSLLAVASVSGDHPTERSGCNSCVVGNAMVRLRVCAEVALWPATCIDTRCGTDCWLMQVVFGGWQGVRRCAVCEQPAGASVTGEMDHQPDCPAGKVAPKLEGNATTGCKHPFTFVLSMDSMEWTQPLIRGTLPTRRYSHSTTAVDSRVLIFGGWDGNRPLNDVVQLDFN